MEGGSFKKDMFFYCEYHVLHEIQKNTISVISYHKRII